MRQDRRPLSVRGNVQKSPSSKAAALLTRGAYSQYVSTAKGRERRWPASRSLGEGWRLFSTFPKGRLQEMDSTDIHKPPMPCPTCGMSQDSIQKNGVSVGTLSIWQFRSCSIHRASVLNPINRATTCYGKQSVIPAVFSGDPSFFPFFSVSKLFWDFSLRTRGYVTALHCQAKWIPSCRRSNNLTLQVS